MHKHNNLKGSLILITASLIWGLAFVAQSDAADHIPPFAFNALRSFLAALFLGAVMLVRGIKTKQPIIPKDAKAKRTALSGGLLCGIFLTLSVNLQQAGLTVYPEGVASSARGGFITALYVVIVPILSIIFGKKINPVVWPAVAIAIAGIYLLCLSGGMTGIYLGDILMMGCAISFSFQIMTVDRFGETVGGTRLCMIQFAVCGVLSLILSFIFEPGGFEASGIFAAFRQIMYLGIMSSGVAYTMQIIGQRYAEPAVASLSMSLESVFAALGGWIIASDVLSGRELIGCILVFAAITVVQLPEIIKKKT